MRWTIIAGLIMGLALAILSALGTRAPASVAHAYEIRPAHENRADARRVQVLLLSTRPALSENHMAERHSRAREIGALAIILWTAWPHL